MELDSKKSVFFEIHKKSFSYFKIYFFQSQC